MRNPQLLIVDGMLHNRVITLSEAYKCWKLVRRRVTAEEALKIIRERQARKAQRKAEKARKMMKTPVLPKPTLEQLIARQERLADLILMANRYSEWGNIEEGFNPNDALNQKTVRLRTEEKFDIDYCYSNTDGAEYLF